MTLYSLIYQYGRSKVFLIWLGFRAKSPAHTADLGRHRLDESCRTRSGSDHYIHVVQFYGHKWKTYETFKWICDYHTVQYYRRENIPVGENWTEETLTSGFQCLAAISPFLTPGRETSRPSSSSTRARLPNSVILRLSRNSWNVVAVELVFYSPMTHFKSFLTWLVNPAPLFLGKPPRQFTSS